jgi:DNA polymerase-3 subunit delta'
MPFDRIEGQARALALLERALAADRVAHAYAFVGPARSGRMTTALTFAEALLCECGNAAGGCGQCRSCVMVGRGQHPDLHVIVPTPPERNPRGPRAIRIGDVRALERQAALRPVVATRKVFVLDEADRMTDDTPQAFLKTLEEPPARTVIVLVLPTVRAVPATVLSRCQVVPFVARPDPATAAARAEALALFGEVLAKGAEALLRRAQSVDREKAEGLVDAYWLFCRDLIVAKAGGPETLLLNAAAAGDIAREAERWSLEELLDEIRTCREARQALETNVSPRLTVEVVLSRLAGRAA